MSLSRILTEITCEQFLDEFYLRLPYSEQGSVADLAELSSWDMLRRLLECPTADVLVTRRGELWPEGRTPTFEEAQQLHNDGYTVAVRHCERHTGEIAEFARGFAADFQAPVNAHLYCTPADQFGFGWHYDAEDVFILQTSGRKEYGLRKNTVNPWPTLETMPADMRYERELMPVMKCELHGGDWLYIPNGYWHVAQAGEAAFSLAVGVLSTTALDVFDFLRPELLDSLFWRQRLPTPGEASAWTEEEKVRRFGEVFADFGQDLLKRLCDERFIRRFLARDAGDADATEEPPGAAS